MIKKKIFTLGICNDETASACLFIDGSLVSAVSEERFSRKKHDKSFPLKSINYLLKEHNIKLSRIDNISYSWTKDFDPKLKKKYKDRLSSFKKGNNKELKIFNSRCKHDLLRDKKNDNPNSQIPPPGTSKRKNAQQKTPSTSSSSNWRTRQTR